MSSSVNGKKIKVYFEKNSANKSRILPTVLRLKAATKHMSKVLKIDPWLMRTPDCLSGLHFTTTNKQQTTLKLIRCFCENLSLRLPLGITEWL